MHHKRTLLSQVCLSPQLSLSPTHQLECCLNLTSSAPLDQLGWSAPLEKATREDEKKKKLRWRTGSHPGRQHSEGRAQWPSPSSRQGLAGARNQAVTPKAGARVYEPRHLSPAHAHVEEGDGTVRGPGRGERKKEQRMSHRHEKTQHSRLAAHVTVCNQHLQHTEYALPHVLVHRFSFAARMPTGQQHSMQILVPHLEIEPALMCRLAVMHTIKCGCCHSSPCQDTGTNSKWFVVPK